jgi:hypothetical protein
MDTVSGALQDSPSIWRNDDDGFSTTVFNVTGFEGVELKNAANFISPDADCRSAGQDGKASIA